MNEKWKQFVEGQIERVPEISAVEFATRYKNLKPVIVSGGARNLDAVLHWDLDYLNKKIGSAIVQVAHYGPDHRDYGTVQRIEMSFRDFHDGIVNQSAENVRYLFNNSTCIFARNEAQPEFHVGWGDHVNPGLAPLAEDFEVPSFFNKEDYVVASLIVGTQQNATILHYDMGGEAKALVQVKGSKRVLLFPPSSASLLHLHTMFDHGSKRSGPLSTQGAVDIHNPDFERFPDLRQLRCLEGEIGPGDILYWPAFWFHDVANIGEVNIAIGLFIDDIHLDALLLRHNLDATLRVFKTFLRNKAADQTKSEKDLRSIERCDGVDVFWNGSRIMSLLDLFEQYEELLLSKELIGKRNLWAWNHALFW